MGMGFAPIWLRQVSPLHKTTLTTAILARDAVHKLDLCCRPVSVTLVNCIQTAEHIVKILHQFSIYGSQ